MSSPAIVIVVLNWNGKEDTLACLESLQRVRTPEHQVLVVDNGSEDGSEEAIRAAYPGVPLLQTHANLGFAGGNNRGIEWALEHGAQYVLLLNNDTLVEADFLERMMRAMHADEQVGIVGASIAYADSPDRLWAFGGGRFDLATGWVRHIQRPVEAEALRPRGNRHFYVTGCAMLLSRTVLEQVGLLDTSYFHFCEDVDLCVRAERAGFGLAVAAGARILHKVSATTRVSSPLFLYYNLRSRLSLVRRHGPPGAPSRWAIALLWLRLWRPALLSGMPFSGWRALRFALRDWKAAREGPAPPEVTRPTGVGRRLVWILILLALVGVFTLGRHGLTGRGGQERPTAADTAGPGSRHGTDGPVVQHDAASTREGEDGAGHPTLAPLGSEKAVLAFLWEGEDGETPGDLMHALYAMAADSSLSRRVLERADGRCRRLTHDLITLLDLSDAQARQRMEGLYEVHDFGRAPGDRPPTWSDLRLQGVLLLQAIAPADDRARDLRLLREIAHDELSRSGPHPRASVVAERVMNWQRWWVDRGMDERFWFDPSARPDPSPWLRRLREPLDAGGTELLDLLVPMLQRPLAFRALLDALDPGRDEQLVSECVRVVMMYQVDFEEYGLPRRHWDARQGRMIGFTAPQLREGALNVFERVCAFLPSGADQNEVIRSIAWWWKGARFQLRYYRDTSVAPSLEPWLGGLDRPVEEGGTPIPRLLREWYVAEGFRPLLLDQLDWDHEVLVAELIEWLGYDAEQARRRGFIPAYRRMPLRPLPGERGRMVSIPWPRVQAMIREMLRHITRDAGLPEEGVDENLRNGFWLDWWRAHAHQPKWYRDGKVRPLAPRFPMERGMK